MQILTVHRALVTAAKLGEGGQTEAEASSLKDIAQTISDLERRSIAAEREASDRYLSAYLSDRVGAEFDGGIRGVYAVRFICHARRQRRRRFRPHAHAWFLNAFVLKIKGMPLLARLRAVFTALDKKCACVSLKQRPLQVAYVLTC